MLGRFLSWSLALALSGLLLAVALYELFGPAPSALFTLLQARSGWPLEPAGRYGLAALQVIVAAVVLNVPSRAAGSVLAAALALILAIGLLVAMWDGAGVSGDDRGMLFLSAATDVLAIAAVYLERVRGGVRRSRGPAEAAGGPALTRG